MRILHFNQMTQDAPDGLGALQHAFPDVVFATLHDPAGLAAALRGTEVLIINNRSYTAANAAVIRDHGSALRWIQFSTSGIDNGATNGFPSGVVVTNVAGLRAFAVAEHALALMLALVRRLRVTEGARSRADWCRDVISGDMDNLAGKHLVILGMGAIGQEIARKAKAFDMQVTAVTRAGGPLAHVDRLRPRAELAAACAEGDIVVIAAGLDESTQRYFGAAAIGAMRRSAYVVNVARGQLVDEPALIEALQTGRIAGAGLDVAATEPLPPDHVFWTMPNVVLTPHVGGAGSAGTADGFGRIFADNLQRFRRGEPLAGVVIARTP